MRANWDKYGIDISKLRGGKMHCPKCHDTRKNKHDKSLSVNVEDGLYKCHNAGCDFEGSVIEFEKKKEYVKPQPKLQKVSDDVLKWFEGRGISNNTLLVAKVTVGKEWMPQNGTEKAVICFNYYRGEELVNVKYRTREKGFKMVSGAELIFYNLNTVLDRETIVICEGEIDCLSYYEAGVPNVISVPNGASMGKHAKLEYLENCWDDIAHVKEFVISVDNDEAGERLRDELVRRLGAHKCRVVVYPEGCKDANDVLLKHGKGGVKKLYEEAELLPVYGVETVYDKVKELRDIHLNGYPKTLKLQKFTELSKLISWRLGEVTTITGIPNHGKSTWANGVFVELAREHDWKFATFTPEKAPGEMLFSELCQIYVGKPFYRKDTSVKMHDSELLDALNFVDEHFYNLKVDEINITVDGLIEKGIEMVGRYGINAYLIDPWNYLESHRDKQQTETEYIGECLTKLANFAKKYQVHVFIIAHPTKMRKDKDGNYEVPDMYSISGSSNFNNKTDNGITVYRDYEDGTTQIHVQKIRWFFIGQTGQVKMKYNRDNQRFDEVRAEPFSHKMHTQQEMYNAHAGMPTKLPNQNNGESF